MHYAKLSVAGCAALMFGLIACSGEDGKDGVNGVNGLNGADGASCEVKSLKDESGYKVLCGGDSVGVLLNGKTGATGKQGIAGATGAKGDTGKTGESCKVEPITDGYKVLCGNKEVGTLKNGANGKDGKSCTTSTATDGIVIDCNGTTTKITNGKDGKTCSATTVKKDGRNGIEMSCDGQVVGTVWDGQDATATGACTSTDKGNGVYELTCGDAQPMTMYKAVCGVDPYDPADKFCVLGKIYDKCGTDKVAYKVNTEFCENGKVVPACIYIKPLSVDDVGYVPGTFQVKEVYPRAPKADEFCWNGIIMPKCDGKTYDDYQFCGKTADKSKDSLMTYCGKKYNIDAIIDQWVTYKEKTEKEYNTYLANNDDDDEPNIYGNLIGRSVWNEDINQEKVVDLFTSLEGFKLKGNQFCEDYEKKEKCGTKTLATKTQFCDKRDETIYNKVVLTSETGKLTWMAENLNFAYKLPQVLANGKASVGTDINWEDTLYQNYSSDITAAGRYYSWYAAVGAEDIRTSLDENGKVKFVDGYVMINDDALPQTWYDDDDKNFKAVPGACPAGWRLPTKDELTYVMQRSKLATKFNLVKSGYYNITFSTAPVENETDVPVVTMNKTLTGSTNGFLWTRVALDDDDEKAYGLVDASAIPDKMFEAYDKNNALPIRCVRAFDELEDEE